MSINVNSLDDIVYVITNEDEVVYLTTIPNDIGQSPIQFQEEGVNVGVAGSVNTIDFVGATVTISQVGGKLTVTITSAGGGVSAVGNLTPLFTASIAGVTMSFAQIVKAANLIFAGPATGADANPDFRALVAADIPNLASVYQPLDTDLTAIAGLSPTDDDIIQRKSGAWVNRTLAQLRTDLGYVYTIPVGAGITDPADATTYYIDTRFAIGWNASAGATRTIFIPKSGIITGAYVNWSSIGVNGSNENISIYLYNTVTTTATLIATIGNTANAKQFHNSSLNIAVTVGDTYNIQIVCPTWGTNPTQISLGGFIVISQ